MTALAERPNSDVAGMNARQGSYPAVEAFLRRIYPDADIQIGANGSITLRTPVTNRTFDPILNREALELFPPDEECSPEFLEDEPSGTMSLEWSFSRKNPAYAQNLPIRHFILSELQMAQFFSNPSLRPEPLDFYAFSESKLYLVVQIKNKGPRFASGRLYFPFFNKSFFISVDVEENMGEFSTYVVPLGVTRMEDFKDAKDVSDRLDNLLWDKVSVGLTEEEIINVLEHWIAGSEVEKPETAEDPEEEESRFPIFRSIE